MADRDLVTRFIGFYNGYEKYQSDLDTFLNSAMCDLKKINYEERQKIKNNFIKAMDAAYSIFENDAFRKRYNIKSQRNPINKALFDSWSVNLAKLSQNKIEILVLKKQILKEKFISLMNNVNFEKSVTSSTGDYRAVERRFSMIKNLIDEVLLNDQNS